MHCCIFRIGYSFQEVSAPRTVDGLLITSLHSLLERTISYESSELCSQLANMEVSRGDAPRNEHVQIEVDQEHVFVLFNEERQQLEEGAVRRSKLLTDLLDSQPGQATLPVDAASLHNWRKHVQLQLTDESYEGLSNVEAKEEMVRLMKVRVLCSLNIRRIRARARRFCFCVSRVINIVEACVQVSEFLLDTETGHRTARALADALLVKAEAGSVENKVRTVVHKTTTLVQVSFLLAVVRAHWWTCEDSGIGELNCCSSRST